MLDGTLIINGSPAQRADKGLYISANTAPNACVFRETLPNSVQFDTLDLEPQSGRAKRMYWNSEGTPDQERQVASPHF